MTKPVRNIFTKVIYIFCVIILIFFFQFTVLHSPAARHFYLYLFYPFMARTSRLFTGWCPFSIGDIIYVLVFAWLLIGVVKFVQLLIQCRKNKTGWLNQLLRFLLILVSAYGIFLVFWGINYRCDRLRNDLSIEVTDFSTTELIGLCDSLAIRTNEAHHILAGNDTTPVEHFLTFREIKNRVPIYYQLVSKSIPELSYNRPSLKPSMFGYLMNYAGITGYFNPFTGEGQVNTTPMPVGLPFTACHEVAHQLGYAAEDDANFIGYLVAASAPDTHFQYAANFEMFLYGINLLSLSDPDKADSLWNQLLTPGVKKDYEAAFAFYEQFRTSVRPVLNDFYDQYLKANEQIKGIKSYNEVIALLIDYVREKGTLPKPKPPAGIEVHDQGKQG